MNFHQSLPALLLLLAISGCDNARQEPGGRDTSGTGSTSPTPSSGDTASPSTDATPQDPGRPITKSDTLMVEGMPEPVELELVGEGMPFSTYMPNGDFKIEQASSGEGSATRFNANFGGTLNTNAYLSIFIPNENYSLERMKELVAGTGGVAQSNGWRLEEPASERCPWAHLSYLLYDTTKGEEAIGVICIGRHAGQSFYTVMHYPREYAEGFVPRAGILLRELRWNDTKEGMERE